MTLGKREKMMIGALAGLLYLLILFKFTLLPSRTEINDVNTNLKSLQAQKKQLDNDYENIEKTKANLLSMKSQLGKLDSYIMSNANIIDAVEYLDRLVQVAGQMKSVKITAPVASANPNGTNYYETQIDFNLNITQPKLYNLISYIEQGSLKAGIKKLSISGDKDGGKTYKVNMTMCLYSMNQGNTDKFTEFSRHKLSEFNQNNGVFFDPSSSYLSPNTSIATDSSVPARTGPDIVIKEVSYLAAGPNLQMYGGINASNSINVKTNKPADVNIELSGAGYSVITKGDDGNDVSLTGSLPEGDVSISVSSDINDVNDNKDIRLNIKIQNNTSKRVNITVKDNSNRVSFFDRDNTGIVGDSSKEKVIIY